MDRIAKESLVQTFQDKVQGARLAIVADYRGLDVNTLTEFRKSLSAVPGSEFRVVKNRLFKRAIAGTDMADLHPHFVGTNAVLLGSDEVVGAAKALVEFAKANDAVKIKGGVLDGKAIQPEQVKALADLPSKEILQAMLLGVLQAPARNLVSLLANVNRQLLNVLVAYRDKLEEGGD